MLVTQVSFSRSVYCVKLHKSLYGVKQLCRMWYNRLSEFLLMRGYIGNDDCRAASLRVLPMDFPLSRSMLVISISLAMRETLMKHVII
jgi:hypothetical protein